jgi:hypothetical protein
MRLAEELIVVLIDGPLSIKRILGLSLPILKDLRFLDANPLTRHSHHSPITPASISFTPATHGPDHRHPLRPRRHQQSAP